MQEQVNVLSAEQYFKKYAVDGIGKGADRWMIKRQLIDAFRKEIFGLVTLRTKKSLDDILPEGDPEARRVAKNVIHDTTMKWKKLCGMFAKYKETAGLLELNDLKLYDEAEEEEEHGGNGNDSPAAGGELENRSDRSGDSEADRAAAGNDGETDEDPGNDPAGAADDRESAGEETVTSEG